MFEDTIGYEGQYFEPFCGLLGVGIHFAKEGRSVRANDINKDLILMLKQLRMIGNHLKFVQRRNMMSIAKVIFIAQSVDFMVFHGHILVFSLPGIV